MITTVNLAFSVSGQTITAEQTCPYLLASNTVNYVKVHFTLDEEWAGVQTVSAVWSGVSGCICTLLDSNGDCFVPQELLAKRQKVYVNLSGSDTENNEVIDRLTTYPLYVINVNATAYTNGSETVPVTPSQFEQFIQQVIDLVGTVKDIDRIEITDDYYLVVYYSDGTQSDPLGPVRGPQGEQGPQGEEGPQGETGNGISSITLYSTSGAVKTYRITFTDGTHFDFQVTDGEVTRAELASVLPTDTASGSIASFEDGSDLFDYLSCVVNIEPVQDLHGYDKPWVGGAGKNKFNPDNTTADSYINDGGVIVGGTQGWSTSDYIVVASSTEYTFNPNSTEGNAAKSWFYDANKEQISYIASGQRTFTTPANCVYMRFSFRSTSTNIQLELGSTATTFEPWENICPITGWTGCEVSKTGKNVLPVACETTTKNGVTYTVYKDANGAVTRIHAQGTATSAHSFTVVEGVSTQNPFTLKAGSYWFGGLTDGAIGVYDLNLRYAGSTSDIVQRTSKTAVVLDEDTQFSNCYLYIYSGKTINTDIYPMIWLQSDASDDFESYNPNSAVYNITWQTEAGTVYGGTVDVVTGVLTVTHKVKSCQIDTIAADTYANVVYGRLQKGQDNASYGNFTTHGEISSMAFVAVSPTGGWDSANGIGGVFCGAQSGNYWVGFPIGTTLAQMQTLTADAQLVYELATPQTYQLTGEQIDCLLGQNNVWANCGNIEEVKYKADVQRYIAKVTA